MRITLRKMHENPRHTDVRIFINGAYSGDVTLHTGDEVNEFLDGFYAGFGDVSWEDRT